MLPENIRAFVSLPLDPAVAREVSRLQRRLEAAGAKYFEEVKLPDGSHLITLRDPWGVPIQLCRRGRPML